MTTATKPLKTWTIEGTQEDGTPETTTVVVTENPEWAADECQCLYLVTLYVDGEDHDGDMYDVLEDAIQRGKDMVDDAADAYRTVEADRRESRSGELVDVAAYWHPSDDRDAVEAVAEMLARGRGGEVLAALRAAGLV